MTSKENFMNTPLNRQLVTTRSIHRQKDYVPFPFLEKPNIKIGVYEE